MKVKIKDKDKLIDATIEVVDGVMIVSPKKVKFEPKDGDIVAIYNKYRRVWMVAIFKENQTEFSVSIYCEINGGGNFVLNKSNIETDGGFRLATEEEKQKLFDKIDAEGYEWNPDERKLVRKKWKPIKYEMFYCPILNATTFGVYADGWSGYNKELELLNKGWVFPTKEECEEFCNRLNQAINQIKP